MTPQNNVKGIVDGRRSRLEVILRFITDWRYILVLGGLVAWAGAAFGYWTLPEFTDVHKITLLGGVGGWFGIKYGIWPIAKGRIRSTDVEVELIGLDNNVLDTIFIPEDEWIEYTIVGGSMRDKHKLSGRTKFAARGIDTEEKLIVPDGDRPEDPDIPDHLQILGAGAKELYNKLKGPALDEFRQKRRQVRERTVIKEEAKFEEQIEQAETMENIGRGDIEVTDTTEVDADRKAGEIVLDAVKRGNPGDDDE
ncbi:hypothetical protein [Haloferax sulfurifontis]|uniref:Uncharacterized protein n=1 Tax=Haloferax sulfurifontis TaxID=255616 RepID=A0A830E4I7_9EURY|nr:hypothetical protein [Haloferax sulfurifontis]GGC49800.1 hypothetical protein GCM10007209_09340 [Haloferax sulfurifontis]